MPAKRRGAKRGSKKRGGKKRGGAKKKKTTKRAKYTYKKYKASSVHGRTGRLMAAGFGGYRGSGGYKHQSQAHPKRRSPQGMKRVVKWVRAK